MSVPMNETPEAKQARIDSSHRYQSYMRGWRDAASIRAMRPEFSEHSDVGIRAAYDLGYAHGYAARGEASKAAQERYDYTPSILRTATG